MKNRKIGEKMKNARGSICGAFFILMLAASPLSAQVLKENFRSSGPKDPKALDRSSVQDEQSHIYDFEQRFRVFDKKIPYSLNWSLGILQEGHAYENADLRETNSESPTEIRDTDDRQAFTVTRAKLDTLFTFPEQRLGLEFSLGFDGVWGHDQLQGYSNPGTRIGRANVFWNPVNTEDGAVTLTVGRQYFSIGGIPYDYMQRDILDAIVLDSKVKGVMEIRALLLDVYSGANNFGSGNEERWNDEFQFLTRDEAKIQEGLGGDVSTYRWGLILSFEEFFAGLLSDKTRLDLRFYGFYAHVRGNDGGFDRTENGVSGNFPDEDWSALAGERLTVEWLDLDGLKSLLLYGDAAISLGKDKKRDGEADADYMAVAGGGGLQMETESSDGGFAFFWETNGFYAEGPQHNVFGDRTSHGFVSFKGNEVGGLLFRRYWGVHPSGYVDDDGIDETPYSANRKSGLLMGHLALGVRLGPKWMMRADVWHMQDTGKTAIPFGTVLSNGQLAEVEAATQNPFLSQGEINVQKKLGKTLGQEYNLTLQYEPNDLLRFYFIGAYFARGDFYTDPVPDIVAGNGTPSGGESDVDFAGASLGMELSF